MLAFALTASLAISLGASEPPRISVLPFTGGAKGRAAYQQLLPELCERFECVSPSWLAPQDKPIWRRVRRVKVDHLVGGHVLDRETSRNTLVLFVWDGPGRPTFTKRFKVRNGRLSQAALRGALAELAEAMGGGGSGAPEGDDDSPASSIAVEQTGKPVIRTERRASAEAREEADDETDLEEVVDGARASAEANAPGEAAAESETKADADAREAESLANEPPAAMTTTARPPPGAIDARTPFLAIEVGTELFSRAVGFTGPTQREVRSFVWGSRSGPGLVAPRAAAELNPFGAQAGVLRGLGLKGSFAMTVGAPASTSLDLGAHLRLNPVPSSGVRLGPAVGFTSRRFSFATPEGDDLVNVPGAAYQSVRVGMDGELLFSGEVFAAFASVAYLHVLSSGPLLSETFFGRGSVFGLEGSMGARLRVTRSVELKLAGYGTRFGYSFQVEPDAPRFAAGAVDQFLGWTLAARYTL